MTSSLLRVVPPPFCAFTYGSSAVRQGGSSGGGGRLLDYLLVLRPGEDAAAWHAENIRRNPSHYSSLIFRSGTLAAALQKMPAGVYYNTDVVVPGPAGAERCKYGVTTYESLVDDLRNWTFLYAAGRLHKPVNIVRDSSDGFLEHGDDVAHNRTMALHAAVLRAITRRQRDVDAAQLYRLIVGLSYLGDVRVGLAESPTKIDDIVSGAVDRFDALYLDQMKRHPALQFDSLRGRFDINGSGAMRSALVHSLPPPVAALCVAGPGCGDGEGGCARGGGADDLEKVVTKIVKYSSTVQTLKGIITAGPFTSLTYALRKVTKRFL